MEDLKLTKLEVEALVKLVDQANVPVAAAPSWLALRTKLQNIAKALTENDK